MNKKLQEVVKKEVSELDLVKTYLAFFYEKYNNFTINWVLDVTTRNELQKLGVDIEVVNNYYHGDYTIVKYPE